MLAFSQHLSQSLERAAAFAERIPEDVTAAHLLLALADDPDAAPVMQACNVDLEQLRRAILASMPAAGSAQLPDEKGPRFSQGFQADLQRASVQVQSAGRNEINGADVLIAMLAGPAAGFLQAQGMTRYDATTFISHGITKNEQTAPRSAGEVAAQASSGGSADSPMLNVRLLNDEFTPMEFVVHVLKEVFGLEQDDAIRVMLQTHHQGMGACGTYPREEALAKAAKVMDLARQHQHPLRCHCGEARP
jgi:ATP-dependent Clp protease ATP-binding subunit ClpA